LQAERTALAWNRTGMAVFANALLALRAGWTTGVLAVTALAFALLIASASAFAFGAWRRYRLLSPGNDIAPSAHAMALAAGIMLLACATGLASIWMRQLA
jgi:uncharacterized membrane protein YidH (DUF202 family)